MIFQVIYYICNGCRYVFELDFLKTKMKTPKKSNKVYARIKRDILRRRYQPDELLPKEMDFAMQLGVSRDTLRHALAMLEAESLVRRVRGYGTYVSASVPRQKITFLLPCSEQIISSEYVMGVLRGVLSGAAERNCEVETLAVSPTNDPNDIDWSKLFNLNSESRVVVTGLWFSKIFPFLLASKSRVAIVCDGKKLAVKHKVDKIISRWFCLVKRVDDNAARMAEHLLRCGCRKPVFFMNYLETSAGTDRLERITEICRQFSPEVKPLFIPIAENIRNDTEKLEALAEKHLKDYPCDGFLVSFSTGCKIMRKRFPDCPGGFVDLPRQKPLITPDKNLFYSDFDLEKIGDEAVRLLLSEKSSEEIEYFADIHSPEPESAP